MNEMHQDIRRLATNLDVKLTAVQELFINSQEQAHAEAVNNLKNCVRSAATVLSSVGPVAPDEMQEAEIETVDCASEVTGRSSFEALDSTLRWVYSVSRVSPQPRIDQVDNVLNSSNSQLLNHSQRQSAEVQPADKSPTLSYTGEDNNPMSGSPLRVNKSLSEETPRSTPRELDIKHSKESSSPQSLPLPEKTTPISHRPKSRSSWFRSQSSHNRSSLRSENKPKQSLEKAQVPVNRLQALKFVFVGDGACGKTCFLTSVLFWIDLLKAYPCSVGVLKALCPKYVEKMLSCTNNRLTRLGIHSYSFRKLCRGFHSKRFISLRPPMGYCRPR